MLIGKLKRLIGFMTAAAIAFAAILAMPSAAFALAPPPGVEITDIYSSWAENDVFMAQKVYNLGNEGTYSNFRGSLPGVKFAPVYESLKAAFKSENVFEPGNDLLTRGQIVYMLYNLLDDEITGGKGGDEGEAVGYFIDAGLIFGRSPDDYQLLENCTVEEMIALAARVYNHGIYEAGKYSTGFCWEVEGAGNMVYLLGSIHLSDDSMYPFSKPIELAFARSANLVVEADIAEISEESMAYVMQKAMIDPKSGKTIADYISAETYELYVEVCESLGLPKEAYNYLMPWMAFNTIQMLLMAGGEAQTLTDNVSTGVDMYFIKRAVAIRKNLMQLESVEFQMDMFASFSMELQEMLLEGVLQTAMEESGINGADDADDADGVNGEDGADGAAQSGVLADIYQAALAAMKAGDEAAVIRIFGIDAEIKDPLMIEYHNKMFVERDKAMAANIAELLEGEADNGGYFIVVGAAHLLSKDSVIAQLADMGYAAVRMK